MDDLPPPYSPPSPVPTTAIPTVLIQGGAVLPPSYSDVWAADDQPAAVIRERAASLDDQTVATPTSPTSLRARFASLRPQRLRRSSLSPTDDHNVNTPSPRRVSADRTVHSATSLPSKQGEKAFLEVLRRVPWRRAMGDVPVTAEDALYQACLLASEEHVQPLLDIGTPITFTDRYAAMKMAHGSALHGALLGAAPHLVEHLTQVFWGRAYAAALEDEKHASEERESSISAVAPEIQARAEAIADEKTRALMDGRDTKGCTPMHIAGQVGATDAVRVMLRRGAELDCVDDLGRTPLHMAARYGREEAADLFVSLGAKTGHLMPRPTAETDAAYGWSECDGADSLWFRARGKRLVDLGNYQFVTRFVSKIAARNNKMGLETNEDETYDRKGKSVIRAPIPARDAYEGSSKPSAEDPKAVFVHGSGRPRPSPPVTDPYDLSVPTVSPKGKSPLDRWRRTGTEFDMPKEYITWREGLDKLKEEHMAQLERNKKAEIPEGYESVGTVMGSSSDK